MFQHGAVSILPSKDCSVAAQVGSHHLPPVEALRELMQQFGKDPVYPALWLFPAYNGHTGVGELSLTYVSNTCHSFNGMSPADMSMIVTADH